MNAGGVTVSYFEYAKNLGHISPGKMQKRWESRSKEFIYGVINDELERMGKEPLDHTAEMEGASEKDLVYSGLEQVMCDAIEETHQTAEEEVQTRGSTSSRTTVRPCPAPSAGSRTSTSSSLSSTAF